MIKMTKKHLGLCSFIFAGLAMLLTPMSVSAWEPQKPVEFVIMAGAGGGADKMARLMQMLIEKKGCPPCHLLRSISPVALEPKPWCI